MVRLLSPLEILRQKSSGLLGPSPITTQSAPATSLLPAQSAPNLGMLGPGVPTPPPRAPIQPGVVSPLVAPGAPPPPAGGVSMQQAHEARQMQVQQRAGGIAQIFANATGKDVVDAAIPWIRETAEGDSGPGKPQQSFLAKLFAGEVPPGISQEDADRIGRNARVMAGLAILASDRTGLAAIAEGIGFARREATASIGELVDEQARQERVRGYRNALSDEAFGTELERWQEVRRRMLADGQLDALPVVTDIIKDLRSLPADADQRVFRVFGGNAVWISEQEGKAYDLSGREITAELLDLQQAAQSQNRRTITRNVRGDDGLLRATLFDAETGEQIRDLGISEAVKTQQSGTSRVDRATADTLDRELAILDEVFRARGFRPFNRIEAGLLNEARSAPQQRSDAAAKNVVSLIIRARSGAQASELEARRLESFSVPLPGDAPEVVREKLARLRAMADDLRGGGSSPAITSGAPVDLDAADRILSGGGN